MTCASYTVKFTSTGQGSRERDSRCKNEFVLHSPSHEDACARIQGQVRGFPGFGLRGKNLRQLRVESGSAGFSSAGKKPHPPR